MDHEKVLKGLSMLAIDLEYALADLQLIRDCGRGGIDIVTIDKAVANLVAAMAAMEVATIAINTDAAIRARGFVAVSLRRH